MDNNHFINVYKQFFKLQNATFTRIKHEDAMVAIVFHIKDSNNQFILKICPRPGDYLREIYFLNYFKDKLPVPAIIEQVAPKDDIPGAILLEYLSGRLLKKSDFTDSLADEIGVALAHIHASRVKAYGDLTIPSSLNSDPQINFTHKFEESLAECRHHFTKEKFEQCQQYYESNIYRLVGVDGPCIIHRDFRPGNIMIHEGRLQGIIDWSSARASFAEEDFCPSENGEWSVDFLTNQAFLAGYKNIRPIPNYSNLMPLLRFCKAIATIGFLVKREMWDETHKDLYRLNLQFLEKYYLNNTCM